jgi:peptidoglycan/LPS O-acetylase OafA/YrhL
VIYLQPQRTNYIDGIDGLRAITMDKLLSTYANSRDNNFNLIRFIAATLVLFSHSFALALGSGDFEPMRSIIGMTWGSIAVDIFFITSGFLITSSYLARNNIFVFIQARVLRIYPALIVAVVFCILIGMLFTNLDVQEYLSNYQTKLYFFKNITLFFGLEFHLPGVFLDVPYKGAVNGSIWTLPYEVKMYVIIVLILGSISFLNKRFRFITLKNTTLLICIFSVGVYIFNHFYDVLPRMYIRLFAMFLIGATFFIWKDKISLSSKWLYAVPLLLISSLLDKDIFFLFYCLTLPFLVFFLAYVPSGKIRGFNKYGDYSYGIYIYAFPVQQSLAATIPNISVEVMITLSFLVTLFLSILSWHFIEKKCLQFKGKLFVKTSNTKNYV